MRLATFNINSVRARIDALIDWLARRQPDVCCLQETKCKDGDFPYAELQAAGYRIAHHGDNHYNGVAILSRVGLRSVAHGFPGPQARPFDEPRILAATCGGIRVYSIYVPNGRELWDEHYAFKLVWLERLRALLMADGAARRATLVMGDFNVAPTDIDLYDPKRWRGRTHASPPERAAIRALLDLGLADVVRDHDGRPNLYTWWSYRPGAVDKDNGLRIDLALASARVARRLQHAWVDVEERRGPRPSDHAPVVVDLR